MSAILGADGRQCGMCECTTLQPCGDSEGPNGLIEGPCYWVDEDLCSTCAMQMGEDADA